MNEVKQCFKCGSKTLDEAQMEGLANQLIENNLSSVEITRNTKGYNWKIKVKSENAWRASDVAQKIDAELRRKYGTMQV
jgi:hypothetical protein